METTANSLKGAIYQVLEGNIDSQPSRLLQRFIVGLILLNGLAVIFESNQVIHNSYRELFHAFELFSVIIFTIEYLSRVWTSTEIGLYEGLPKWRAQLRYMFTPMALIDLPGTYSLSACSPDEQIARDVLDIVPATSPDRLTVLRAVLVYIINIWE